MKLNQLLAARHVDIARNGYKSESADVSSGYFDSSKEGVFGKRKIATIQVVGTKVKMVVDALIALPSEEVIESMSVLFDFDSGTYVSWDEVNGQETLFKL